MSDRYKSSVGSRRSSSTRRKASRHHTSSGSGRSSIAVSEKDGSSSSGSGSEDGMSIPRPRKTRRRDPSYSSHHPHDRKQRHRHRPKALPAPLEEDEKASSDRQRLMQVAIREDYAVQTVPRRASRSVSSTAEQVYDHRPLSRRSRSRHPKAQGAQQGTRAANGAEHGYLVGAVLFILSMLICCGGTDES